MSVSKAQTLRINERIKHLASALTTLGIALTVGSITRMQLAARIDVYGLLWIFGSLWLILFGSLLLTLLQSEDEI